jgi:hypothetical protein
VKSDEKASLAPRTAGERAPLAHAKNGKAGTPLRTLNLLAASAKVSPEAANVRKVRTVL